MDKFLAILPRILRDSRIRARVPQHELAEIAGVARETVSRAERVQLNITVGALAAIMGATGWRLERATSDTLILRRRDVALGDLHPRYHTRPRT